MRQMNILCPHRTDQNETINVPGPYMFRRCFEARRLAGATPLHPACSPILEQMHACFSAQKFMFGLPARTVLYGVDDLYRDVLQMAPGTGHHLV
jgi:hypothetical protein